MPSIKFSHGLTVECPNVHSGPRKQYLTCIEQNYSGCGTDIGHCEECGHAYEVHFKVFGAKRCPMFDTPSRQENEDIAAKEKAAKENNAVSEETAAVADFRAKILRALREALDSI